MNHSDNSRRLLVVMVLVLVVTSEETTCERFVSLLRGMQQDRGEPSVLE